MTITYHVDLGILDDRVDNVRDGTEHNDCPQKRMIVRVSSEVTPGLLCLHGNKHRVQPSAREQASTNYKIQLYARTDGGTT